METNLKAKLTTLLDGYRSELVELKQSPYDPEAWSDSQWNLIKERLGMTFAHVPTERLRRYAVGLRKAGKLKPVTKNAHGKEKLDLSPEHKKACERLRDSGYFDDLCRQFEWRCAMCYASVRLEPHHRHYETLGNESGMDVIPVCRECHKKADERRRRVAKRAQQGWLTA